VNLKEFKHSGHWPSLLCAFLYFDISFMLWTLLGALGVFVAQAFHLSPGQKGLLVAIPLLGGAVLRIVLGIATDHCGPRKVGLAGMTLTFIPLLWGWLHSTSLGDMWAIGLLLGIAGASFAVALRSPAAGTRRACKDSRWGSPAPAIPARCCPRFSLRGSPSTLAGGRSSASRWRRK
jgi:nitrate/nitrite transporter NarK